MQELEDESLVYDREADVAHCLSSVAARVWGACDGTRDLPALAVFVGESESLVADAIGELREKRLFADEPALPDGAAVGVSRRRALKRIAGAGLVATSAPLIFSAAAPPAYAAGSLVCQPCDANGNCGGALICATLGALAGVCIPGTCSGICVLGGIPVCLNASNPTCTNVCNTGVFLCC